MAVSLESRLENAFTPAKPSDDPRRFAARTSELEAALQSLHSNAECPLIVGSPGIGKSSLAGQVYRIATGEKDLLKRRGLSRYALSGDDAFHVAMVPCTTSLVTYRDIVERMVEAFRFEELVEESVEPVVDTTLRTRLSIRVLEREKIAHTITSRPDLLANGSPEVRLDVLVTALQRVTGRRTLFIVDEAQKVGDPEALAGFISAYSSDYLRFVVVGRTRILEPMMEGDDASYRKVVPIPVPLMNHRELNEIIDLATVSLENDGVNVTFSDRAREFIVTEARGFPWYVHVLGRGALRTAFGAGREEVRRDDAVAAMSELVEGRFSSHFNQRYMDFVGSAPKRELFLRGLARWEEEVVPPEWVRYLARQIDLTNLARVRRALLSSDGDVRILRHYGVPKNGLLSFENAVYKAYVQARPPMFGGVAERVEAIYLSYFGGQRAP